MVSEDENDWEGNIPLSLFPLAYENVEGESGDQSEITLEDENYDISNLKWT